MGQRTYRVDLAPSVIPELLRIPCAVEQRLRSALAEIADAASGLPPIGHPAWRRWRGIGEECFSIAVAGWTCTYALEPSLHRVIVLGLAHERLPYPALHLPDRPLYAN